MLQQAARRADDALQPLALVLARTGITPNALTVLALIVSLPVAPILARGPPWFPLAGALIVLALVLDGLDGLVARSTGQVTFVGDFLDATLDRYGEGVFFIGLLYWYISSTPPDVLGATLSVLTLFGSLMVSYTRARAEVVDVNAADGIFQRLVRLTLLVLGLVLAPLVPQSMPLVLVVLAVGSNVTAIQRLFSTTRQLAARDASTRTGPKIGH
jgi:CDP-diacylglycerol--glycerol-3-phosphate 3-phosphatidyltransferase